MNNKNTSRERHSRPVTEIHVVIMQCHVHLSIYVSVHISHMYLNKVSSHLTLLHVIFPLSCSPNNPKLPRVLVSTALSLPRLKLLFPSSEPVFKNVKFFFLLSFFCTAPLGAFDERKRFTLVVIFTAMQRST